MQKQILFPTLLIIAFTWVSCQPETTFEYYYYSKEDKALLDEYLNLPTIAHDYRIQIPGGAGVVNSDLVNSEKATLGRVLFYDKKLSKDQTISCASCHKQELAFGDDHATSKGVFDRSGDRNSISLLSVTSFATQYGNTSINGGKRFFWDNRAATAAEQAIGSMSNPKEMDMHETDLIEAVQSQPFYKPLFKKAFGDTGVTRDRIANAIANFVNAMGSAQSRFDIALGGVFNSPSIDFPSFTAQENYGKSLYLAHCSNCHGDINVVFSDQANNGLDLTTTDRGIGAITNNPKDDGQFKVPSLRNIMLTAPYMHDGRFKTLDEVFEHYATGIKAHPNLSSELINFNSGKPKFIQLTASEKDAMIAFFNTLTDQKALTDERFSNPFK